MKQSIKIQPSVWPDNAVYFLTDSTFIHFPYFKTAEQKQIVLNQIKKIEEKVCIKVEDYSIAINHYHLKFYLERGFEFAKIKQILRGGISYEYRKNYEVPYKEMWQSGKILILRTEEIGWKVSGYIMGNLLKHKEVSTFKELKENKFSSYRVKATEYGDEDMEKLVYKVIDVGEDAWGGIDTEELDGVKIIDYPRKVSGH